MWLPQLLAASNGASLPARVYKKGKESIVLSIAVCKHPLKSTEVNVTSVAKCYVIITANTSR